MKNFSQTIRDIYTSPTSLENEEPEFFRMAAKMSYDFRKNEPDRGIHIQESMQKHQSFYLSLAQKYGQSRFH
jgi:hypothetical protein